MIKPTIYLETLEETFFSEKQKFILGFELDLCQGNCRHLWKSRTTPKKASGASKRAKIVIFKEDGYLEMCRICVVAVLKMLLST